jgi:hypothetical protein
VKSGKRVSKIFIDLNLTVHKNVSFETETKSDYIELNRRETDYENVGAKELRERV